MAKRTVFDFSKRAEALLGQEMFKILEHAKSLERQGKKVYHLELGDPKIAPPQMIIRKTIQALRGGQLGYCPSAGILELRSLVADHFSVAGRRLNASHVAISPANFLVSQVLDIVCDTQDKVVLFTPCFPTYLAATQYLRLSVRQVPLPGANGFHLTRGAIDDALRSGPKIVIVNSGNNPTGAVYAKNVLRYLIKRCREKGIWILSDETYSRLSFEREYFSLAGCSYPKLVVISSLSKMLALPAFRTGLAIAHPQIIKKIILSSSTSYSCLPVFVQAGIARGFGEMEAFTRRARKHYAKLVRECVWILRSSQRLSCVEPESAFYLFIDIRKTGLTDIDFSKELLRRYHTAVTPGTSFGYPGYVRASVCGHAPDVKKGIKRLVAFAAEE